MTYANDDRRAISAMEIARLGNYGEYEQGYCKEELVCPICGVFEPYEFYINDEDECVGCSECVYSSERPY